MTARTNIEWADSTFNPWIGCTKISAACDHCYAEAMMDSRLGRVRWGAGQPRQRTSAAYWRHPVRWNSEQFWQCQACGWRGIGKYLIRSGTCPGCDGSDWEPARRRVFCASLADVFDNEVDPQWRDDLFALIRATPNLDWLLLTKRIGNVAAMVATTPGWMPPNVWLGATICNQDEADRDVPKLLALPARVRFLSIEPMLGPITFRWAAWEPIKRSASTNHLDGLRRLDWVIVGGESGRSARPMHPDWVRSLRDQCAEAGVPFLFKQWGEWAPRSHLDAESAFGRPLYRMAGSNPNDCHGYFVGKKVAGNTLDGRQHLEWPR